MTAIGWERLRKIGAFCVGLYFLYMSYLLLVPCPRVPSLIIGFNWKHWAAFCVLSFGVGMIRRRSGWSVYCWFALLLAWCFGSEILQIFTGRCFEWNDIANNVVGVLTGLPAAVWTRIFIERTFVVDKGDVC